MQDNKNQPVINQLNELIQACEDSTNGYKDAAEHLKEGELSTIFYRLSQQRALFREELKGLIRDLGGEATAKTEVSRELKRIWAEFKSGLNGTDTVKIIQQSKQAEVDAIKEYEEVLKTDTLPAYVKEKLVEQHHLIRGAYDQLEEFEKNPQG